MEMLSIGSSGPMVAAVQQFLNEQSGGSGIMVDGIFGPATYTTVVNFQQRMGIAADGIVGPMTYSTMQALGFYPGGC